MSLCVPPHPSEPDHIKDLKTRPFLSEVCVGTDAVENCLKIIIEHAIDAAVRTNTLKKHYERRNFFNVLKTVLTVILSLVTPTEKEASVVTTPI